MKKSTIITILAFVVGVVVLTAGFILFTDNNIKDSLFPEKSTTTTTTTTGSGGTTEPELEPMDFFDVDVSQYVTLGEYLGFTFDVNSYTITDADIDEQLLMMMYEKRDYTEVNEGTVGERVIFSFDFKGYCNDVPFEGGSGTNQIAYISGDNFILTSGSTFIDGFAQGVLGAKVGVQIEVPVTFPEDYHSEDLAGKDAVFKVTVRNIYKTEFTDALAEEYSSGAYKTVDAFKEYLKHDMQDSLTESIEAQKNNLVWAKIIENADFISIPEEQYNYYFEGYKETIEYYMSMYAMYGYTYTYEQMLQQMGFENEDALKEYARDTVKQELVLYAVLQANLEAVTPTEEEFNGFVDELKEDLKVETAEEVFAKYSEEVLKQQMMLDKTQELVIEGNTFNIVYDSEGTETE